MEYLNRLFSLVLFSFAASAGLALAQVATIFELTGTATASAVVAPGSPAAAARALRKGDGINQGESVSTGPKSNIVIRFLDGQIVSLSANSVFAVTTYAYNQANPGQSSVLLSLVNGGMRAVTGLIGKARPQAVEYRAAGATIGIRGTDVSFAVNGGNLIVNVESGLISFVSATPGAVPVSINAGAGVFAASSGQVTTGNATAVAQALAAAAAVAATPAQAAALGNLAAAIVAVVPANSPVANAVSTAVAGTPAAATAFNNAVAAQPPVPQPSAQAAPASAQAPAQAPAAQTTTTTTGTTTGNSGSSGSSGSGGGGSTLPRCAAIISPVIANPGVNCTR
jgi:hypothetical protein